MPKPWLILLAAALLARQAGGQILLSGGAYSQNFNALAGSGTAAWANNSTLPGWYAAKGNSAATTYTAGGGASATGSIYSFGTNGVNTTADRALGSLASASTAYAYGVRFTNDTGWAQCGFTVSYTGEQWRNASGAAAETNSLAFSYQVSSAPLTDADAANAQAWIASAALDFNSPVVNIGGSGTFLDGNAAANRQVFTNILLAGVVVQPGQEIFLRWRDVDNSGSDAGMAVDDLTVRFQPVNPQAPLIAVQPQNEAAGEGGFAIFSAAAVGNPLPAFQWRCNGTNLPGATNATLALDLLTTNQSGFYSAVITNAAGVTNSFAAQLRVHPTSLEATNGAIKILTYNVAGNGVADWNTNTAQAQAIGRQLMYWRPDVITFNEIPTNGVALMPNWMKAFLPGYFAATNSFSDGYIQSVIASRFPITRSATHLAFSSLAAYGYTGTGFTRDLFEAQIAVPNWPLPLHAFIAHLKSTGSGNPQDDANKRAAMASAISNYFVNVFLPSTNGTHPYLLNGDMNEDAFYPESSYTSGQPIQRLTSVPTGLQMTIPINPVTRADLTESIRGTLDTRFDYILPCAALFSNIAGGQVFRTDLLTNFPSNLYSNDDKTASDHLPVLMVFNNPFNTPFKLLSVARTNQNLTLQWESQNNRAFNIETSADLIAWSPFVTNLKSSTTNSSFSFATNSVPGATKFFRIYRAP